MDLEPNYEDTLGQEKDAKSALEQAEAKSQTLLAKQARTSRFATKAERDGYLRSEVKKAQQFLASRQDTLASTTRDMESVSSALENCKQREKELRQSIEKRKEDVARYSDEFNVFKRQTDELIEQRKQCWKEDNRLHNEASQIRDVMQTANRTLYSMMDRVSLLFTCSMTNKSS